MSDPNLDIAIAGTNDILDLLGLKGVPAAEVAVIAKLVLNVVDVLGHAAQSRANAAGDAAAALITTDDEAEKAGANRT